MGSPKIHRKNQNLEIFIPVIWDFLKSGDFYSWGFLIFLKLEIFIPGRRNFPNSWNFSGIFISRTFLGWRFFGDEVFFRGMEYWT